MGIAYKKRYFLIQGVSDEIQFLAGNIEHFLDEFLIAGSHIVSQDDKLRRLAVHNGAQNSWENQGRARGRLSMKTPEQTREEIKHGWIS
jgi:hypothetical protein